MQHVVCSEEDGMEQSRMVCSVKRRWGHAAVAAQHWEVTDLMECWCGVLVSLIQSRNLSLSLILALMCLSLEPLLDHFFRVSESSRAYQVLGSS